MREINNENMNYTKKVGKDVNLSKNEIAEETPKNLVCDESIKDFSNPQAECLGRSQVNKSDNIKNDIVFLTEHPSKINNSDKLFELAYKQLQAQGDANAYEKACSISTSEDAKSLL